MDDSFCNEGIWIYPRLTTVKELVSGQMLDQSILVMRQFIILRIVFQITEISVSGVCALQGDDGKRSVY